MQLLGRSGGCADSGDEDEEVGELHFDGIDLSISGSWAGIMELIGLMRVLVVLCF